MSDHLAVLPVSHTAGLDVYSGVRAFDDVGGGQTAAQRRRYIQTADGEALFHAFDETGGRGRALPIQPCSQVLDAHPAFLGGSLQAARARFRSDHRRPAGTARSDPPWAGAPLPILDQEAGKRLLVDFPLLAYRVAAFLLGGYSFKVSQPDTFRIRLSRRSTFNFRWIPSYDRAACRSWFKGSAGGCNIRLDCEFSMMRCHRGRTASGAFV